MPMEIPSESFGDYPVLRTASLTPAERLADRRSAGKPEPLEETAKQFEGILLQQVFKQMKEATESLEVHEEEEGEEAGFGEQVQSMFWMFLGEQIAQEGGVGLWKDMVRQWRREDAMQAGSEGAESAGLDGQV
jgi:Rod binding domain-containing protein